MTIEKERGAKSPTPLKGCDSWRSLAQPWSRAAEMPDVFPPSRTPTVLHEAPASQPRTRMSTLHFVTLVVWHQNERCPRAPLHTIVRNRILADEINSHNKPPGQNGNCRATRLQRKRDTATKRDGDVVGNFRDHPSAKGNRIRQRHLQ